MRPAQFTWVADHEISGVQRQLSSRHGIRIDFTAGRQLSGPLRQVTINGLERHRPLLDVPVNLVQDLLRCWC